MKVNTSTILKEAGLKITPARETILALFTADCKPINADLILKKISKSDINLVTVYRTLNTLEKAKIIKRVDLRKDAVYYEGVNHHHHHLVCVKCGRLESFNNCEIDGMYKNVIDDSKNFSNIIDHSLEIFGTCNKCSQ